MWPAVAAFPTQPSCSQAGDRCRTQTATNLSWQDITTRQWDSLRIHALVRLSNETFGDRGVDPCRACQLLPLSRYRKQAVRFDYAAPRYARSFRASTLKEWLNSLDKSQKLIASAPKSSALKGSSPYGKPGQHHSIFPGMADPQALAPCEGSRPDRAHEFPCSPVLKPCPARDST